MLKQIAGISILILASLRVAEARPAQQPASHPRFSALTIGLTYNAERAKTTSSGCNCFWFQGAAADVGWQLWNNLGIAAQLSGAHASNIGPGVNISKIDFLFGPRYTWHPPLWRPTRRSSALFGEFLLGGIHAFNTIIPTISGASSSATAFALQTGGGANLWLTPRFGLRVLQLDYIYSQLPNGGNSRQNDLRIATGVIWRIP